MVLMQVFSFQFSIFLKICCQEPFLFSHPLPIPRPTFFTFSPRITVGLSEGDYQTFSANLTTFSANYPDNPFLTNFATVNSKFYFQNFKVKISKSVCGYHIIIGHIGCPRENVESSDETSYVRPFPCISSSNILLGLMIYFSI